MATKSITLRAFLFAKEPSLVTSNDDILGNVKRCLESTIAENREMQLNQEDETRESDLLSGYEIHEDNIFATIMRIAPGADDTHIDETLMKKKSFSVGEMKRSATTDHAIYKSHYYICFNNNYLVTNLPRSTSISRVETYLNWLLKSYKYSIIPVIIPTPNLTLADVNTIIFKPFASPNKDQQEEQRENNNKLLALADIILEKIPELLFRDTESLSDIEWKGIISTEIILKVKDQAKIKNNEFQKVFGSLLKPVAEAEQIVLKNRKGESIKGSEILKTKSVEIEMTANNLLVEPKLHQEMARFLDELA